MSKETMNNNVDDGIDSQIYECFNQKNPKSFFLFAGAGSGKTRSLVNVLTEFKKNYGSQYKLFNRKVAIITYTNAAADEIKHRLEYDSIFYVSTIHSFAWKLISPYNKDIKDWLRIELPKSIDKLNLALSKSKNLNNKTSIDNAKKKEAKEKRLNNLDNILNFVYNPGGDNISKDSLNHEEVIKITADFIQNKILMQDIIVSRFPIILVDESQDTKKELIEALFNLQENKKSKFSFATTNISGNDKNAE